jgi:hypothetical protein
LRGEAGRGKRVSGQRIEDVKLGYIEYNGKLEIHNSLLNVVLYDKPEIKRRDASGEQELSD